jgi:hypothetical protein
MAMIDSVTLQLKINQYHKLKQNEFKNLNWKKKPKFEVSTQFCDAYQRKQKNEERYFPSINLPQRKIGAFQAEEVCEIQASIPKTVRKTSIAMIHTLEDLNSFHVELKNNLQEVGIIVKSLEELEKATLKKISFCFNILLPDHLGDSRSVIYRLARFNYKLKSDFTIKEFYDGSDGIMLKFYNNSKSQILYCKFSENRNNAKTSLEKEFREKFEDKRNLLRLELALQRQDTTNKLLRRFTGTKQKSFILKEVFNKELARSVLLDSFDQVYNDNNVKLITLAEMRNNQLRALLNSSDLKPAQKEKLYYWSTIATEYGIKGVQEEIKRTCKGGRAGQVKKEVNELLKKLNKIDGKTPNIVNFLRNEISNFKIIF